MLWGTGEWRPSYSSMRASYIRVGSLGGLPKRDPTVPLSCLKICAIMFWVELALFLKILPLPSFQTSQIKKPGTRVQALLMTSFPEKSFLDFFKVFVMLSLSLSVYLKIQATQSHMVEVKGKRLSVPSSFLVSHIDGIWMGHQNPFLEAFPKLEFSFVEPTT